MAEVKLTKDNRVNPLERRNNLKFAQNLGVMNQHMVCYMFCLHFTRHIGALYRAGANNVI